jgi:hypothetical protein
MYRTTGERATGVVAQELMVTHPEMVHMAANGFYAVDNPKPWKLVKALQELTERRDLLLAELDDQKVAHDSAKISRAGFSLQSHSRSQRISYDRLIRRFSRQFERPGIGAHWGSEHISDV